MLDLGKCKVHEVVGGKEAKSISPRLIPRIDVVDINSNC